MNIFRSPCCIPIPSSPVSCTGGWIQLIAGKEILIVIALLVVYCCTIKKRYCCITVLRCFRSTVHSIERRLLEFLLFIQKHYLGNSVPNTVTTLLIFLTIAVGVATCERSFSKLKLIKNCLRSGMSTLRLINLAILSTEQQLTDKINSNFAIEEFAKNRQEKLLCRKLEFSFQK